MKKLKKNQRKELVRFGQYMVSGGAYFWSGYLVFFAIDKGLRGSFFWAKSISTLVGWTVNYMLQRFWVFKNPALAKHQTEVTGRYAAVTIADFVIDYFLVLGLKNIGISPYIGQFVSSGFFTVWNYLWYKFYVFPAKFTQHSAKTSVARLVAHRPHGHSAYQGVK